MRTPPGAGSHLCGIGGDDLIEDGGLIFCGTEDPAESLDVLANRAGTAQDDGDLCGGHIHALVEDAAGHDHGQAAVLEGGEDGASLLDVRLVADAGHKEVLTHLVGCLVVVSEHNCTTSMFTTEQIRQDL